MVQSVLSRATLIVLSSTLAVFSVACEQRQNSSGTISNHQNSLVTDNFARVPHLESTAPATEPETITPPLPEPRINTFEMALDKAIGAWKISQSAQSPDDWQLVVSQYQDAIALMAQVPPHSPEFTTAQAKINEYRSHIKTARERAIPRRAQIPNMGNQRIVVTVPQPQTGRTESTFTQPASTQQPPAPRSAVITPETGVFIAPIKRRKGGTPIIEVTFNSQQTFDMIVDTGASGTVITQDMARALGVVQVGTIRANTASARTVEFPIGYVDSMSVDGLKIKRVPVAIAGEELDTGLLGHDFFGNYDVTIRRDVIEFRPQSRAQVNSFVETPQVVPTYPKPHHSEEFP